MPFKVVNSEFIVEVDDEPPLHHVGNPDGPQFVPVSAKVIIYDDQIRVIVQGPFLSKTGKVMKRFALTSFDEEQILKLEAPQWVIDLVREVQG